MFIKLCQSLLGAGPKPFSSVSNSPCLVHTKVYVITFTYCRRKATTPAFDRIKQNVFRFKHNLDVPKLEQSSH